MKHSTPLFTKCFDRIMRLPGLVQGPKNAYCRIARYGNLAASRISAFRRGGTR
jgi:hypothetical protein